MSYEMERLLEIRTRLRGLTLGCRESMHEPDEQEVAVEKVVGTHLDNAFGNDPKYDEYCFLLTRKAYQEEPDEEWFNLADIIALARLAQIPSD